MPLSRLLLVSNRLPVTLRRSRSGNTEIVKSSGGLVAGVAPVHQSEGGLWFGYPGEHVDKAAREVLDEARYVPVTVSASEMRGYYSGYSNSSLWPLFHYFIEHARFDRREFEAYRTVNERFADTIAERAMPGDTIWVHDYQLMLLPRLLRERLPSARIGFFLHIPFPSSEVFGLLPQREEILRGLAGADLIGVHTYDYARHLVSSFRRYLGVFGHEGTINVDGRAVEIAAHPLGISVEDVRGYAYSSAAENRVADLMRDMRGRQILLGIDRLDYTKGLPLKLEAFRTLLSDYPKWRDSIVLIQVAIPSRTNIESYRAQKAEVERLVGDINGAFGRPGRVPIHYIYRSIPSAELGALYRVADIAVVTPLRDGMNLVAKEYVAAHSDAPGVLVLSEFAGAATELGEAIRVNPHDVDGTAAALNQALEMPAAERKSRMQAMFRRVQGNDVHAWYRRYRRALDRESTTDITLPERYSPESLAEKIAPALRSAKRSLFLIDYDGTIREFVDDPAAASPTDETLSALEGLTSLKGARVVIVSGRGRELLDDWLGDTDVGLVAEHCLWFRLAPDQEWKRGGHRADQAWKTYVMSVLDEYVGRVPGSLVEEKVASLVWHYRAAADDLANWQARELANYLEEFLANEPLEVLVGAKNVEVRQHGLNKGAAYERIYQEIGPFDFEMAIGDDRTDEDLFAVVPSDTVTIHVGPEPSRAGMSLSSPEAVRIFLRSLTGLVRR